MSKVKSVKSSPNVKLAASKSGVSEKMTNDVKL